MLFTPSIGMLLFCNKIYTCLFCSHAPQYLSMHLPGDVFLLCILGDGFHHAVSLVRQPVPELCNCSIRYLEVMHVACLPLNRPSTFNEMYWPNTWGCHTAPTGEPARHVSPLCGVLIDTKSHDQINDSTGRSQHRG